MTSRDPPSSRADGELKQSVTESRVLEETSPRFTVSARRGELKKIGAAVTNEKLEDGAATASLAETATETDVTTTPINVGAASGSPAARPRITVTATDCSTVSPASYGACADNTGCSVLAAGAADHADLRRLPPARASGSLQQPETETHLGGDEETSAFFSESHHVQVQQPIPTSTKPSSFSSASAGSSTSANAEVLTPLLGRERLAKPRLDEEFEAETTIVSALAKVRRKTSSLSTKMLEARESTSAVPSAEPAHDVDGQGSEAPLPAKSLAAKTYVPLIVGIVSVVIFCLNSEMLKFLAKNVSPLFNLCCAHMGGLLFFPWTKWAKRMRGSNGYCAAKKNEDDTETHVWTVEDGEEQEVEQASGAATAMGASPPPAASGGAGSGKSVLARAGGASTGRGGRSSSSSSRKNNYLPVASKSLALDSESPSSPPTNVGRATDIESGNLLPEHQIGQNPGPDVQENPTRTPAATRIPASKRLRKRLHLFSAFFSDAEDCVFWQKSAFFAFLIMAYNYCFLRSETDLSVATTTALFQSNIAMCGVWEFLSQKSPCSKYKLTGTVLCIAGAALVAGYAYGTTRSTSSGSGSRGLLVGSGGNGELDPSAGDVVGEGAVAKHGGGAQYADEYQGVAFGLAAAFGAAAYNCLLSVMVGPEKSADPAGFCINFGFAISLCHLLLIAPLVQLASAVGFEPLRTPTTLFPDGLGFLASCLMAFGVNLCWFFVLYSGEDPSLLSNVVALAIPISVGLDVVLHGLFPSAGQGVGHAAIVVSFAFFFAHKRWVTDEEDEHSGRNKRNARGAGAGAGNRNENDDVQRNMFLG